MTGYGRASTTLDGSALTVQISSVNRKSLDLTMKLPPDWESLEAAVAERVREVAVRGKVHVEAELAGPGGDEPRWNDAAIEAALDRLAALASALGVAFAPTPELLWQIANSQRRPVELPAAEAAREALLGTLDSALRDFTVMRAKEGEALLADFLGRVAALRRHLEALAQRAPEVVAAYREALLRRLREAGLELDVGDERVLKEIALFADRCDLSEEITRFRSHLEQLTALLRSGGEIGRKAEFILQELGREAHTIGAKANDLAIARQVIELKNELERIREQIANVE
ncbi:MAG TPA: DUF1732 domain-containing protein [Opitutaceae bacterium]|nr:DUF1732 domain-containing protein [Opitutaceae bacterium]